MLVLTFMVDLQAREYGGGNSTFIVQLTSSTGTDTWLSAISPQVSVQAPKPRRREYPGGR